jgi:cytochrome c5
MPVMSSRLFAGLALMVALPAWAIQPPAEVFRTSCGICHDGQLDSAPRKGDTAAWQPRLAKGSDVLLHNVRNGYSVMPPKGMCFTCTDDDLRAVIDWMSH